MAATSRNGRNDDAKEPEAEAEPQTPQVQHFRMPNVEEIRAQEIWNNCAFRSVASGVMGE